MNTLIERVKEHAQYKTLAASITIPKQLHNENLISPYQNYEIHKHIQYHGPNSSHSKQEKLYNFQLLKTILNVEKSYKTTVSLRWTNFSLAIHTCLTPFTNHNLTSKHP